MELREKEGDDAFHPSIEYFLGNVIVMIIMKYPSKSRVCSRSTWVPLTIFLQP